MKLLTNLLKLLIILGLLLVAIWLGLYAYIADSINQDRQQLTELYQLRSQLTSYKATVDDTYKLELINLPQLLTTYMRDKSQLDEIPELKAEKQEMIDKFIVEVNAYKTEIAKFPKVFDLKNFPTNEQMADLEFDVQKDPQAYIAEWKPVFRNQLSEYNKTAASPLRTELQIDDLMEKMTLEQKLGQMVGVGLVGKSLSTLETEFWTEYEMGTAVLFGNNVQGKTQLKKLTNQLQATNRSIPLFISADQEGGTVKRIAWDTTGSHPQIGKMSLDKQCEQWQKRSKTLIDSGVNWNLGIVADVTSEASSFIYPRVFSTSFEKAGQSVARAVECSEQVLSTLKHYPGHGATVVDTHTQLGTIPLSKEAWENTHLKPFKSGIDANVETIMVGHLILKELSNRPATLAAPHIKYLREDLGFKGLIVTDDLMMLTSSGYKLEQAVSQAALAGNDILLLSISTSGRSRVITIMSDLVKKGSLKETEIDLRVKRILEYKNQLIKTGEHVPGNLLY